MKRKATKFLCSLLLVAAIFSICPTYLLSANAIEESETSEVTRSQWLQALVETFDMTVQDEIYPDNYFSDLSSNSEYYYDMLLAVEFGVVDIEAGGMLRPDDAATREFAAQTLNFCLGYQLDEGTVYTYTESAEVTYPDDIQVAVNRGWFELVDGAFLPEQTITKAEMDAMMTDATTVLESTVIDENFESTYEFAVEVIEIPKTTRVSKTETGVIIEDCPKSIAAGDLFAVYFNDIPYVYTAESVRVTGTSYVIEATQLSDEEAYASIEAQGIVDAKFTQVKALDGAEIIYIDEDTETEYTDPYAAEVALMSKGTKELNRTLKAKTKVELGDGISGNVEVTIKNPKIKYDISLTNLSAYVSFVGDAEITYQIELDSVGAILDAAKVKEIRVINYTIPGVGGLVVSVDLEVGGSLSGNQSGYLTAGIAYAIDDGFRLVKEFTAKSFSLELEVAGKAGLQIKLGLTDFPALKGYVYAKVGGKASLKQTTYGDNALPKECVHCAAYLYADYGATAKVKFGRLEKSATLNTVLYNDKNSPLRVVHHYEDGKEVPGCTRSSESGYRGYYTTYDSPYWSSGWSGASGSTGYDRGGNPVIVYDYELDENSNAVITGYNGNATALVIPSEIDGYTVTAIGDEVFRKQKNLRSVIIPDTVVSIGSEVFAQCSNLSNVSLSENLISIERGTFADCISLLSVEIPDTVTNISSHAFANCTNLANVTMSKNLEDLGRYAFESCVSLVAVSLPDSLECLECGAFTNCTSLQRINIPKNMNTGEYAGANYMYPGPFYGCSSLNNVDFAEGITYLPDALFDGCDGLKSVIIPDTVVEMGWGVFKNCINLSEITFSNSLIRTGESCFLGCVSLLEASLPDSMEVLACGVFRDCVSLEKVYIPKGINTGEFAGANYMYPGPFDGCSMLNDITFGEGIKFLPDALFKDCYGLTEITIPETVSEVRWKVFENCVNLKSIVIPDTVSYMGESVFAGCTDLENAEWNHTLSEIPAYTFFNCTSLCDFKFVDTISGIETQAFYNCDSLTSIIIPTKIKELGNYCFEDCNSISEVVLPVGFIGFGEGCFYNCDSITTLALPDSITHLDAGCFYDCDALAEIKLPDSVRSIGYACFYNCEALKTVRLSNKLTIIPEGAFKSCLSIEEIVVPRSVTEIHESAFNTCTKLEKVTIPREVTSIASDAFSYPDRMTIYGVTGTYAETYANEKGFPFVDQQFSATSVSLDCTALILNKYGSASLTMKMEPLNCTDAITWKSSDPNVVTVSDRGVVEGVGIGTATIKVNVGSVSTSCTVTVVQPVIRIRLNEYDLMMQALETNTLVATVYPADAYLKEVVWSTSDENVATVDQNGNVTALKKGIAVITATSKDGLGVWASCTVTVSNSAHIVDRVENLQSPHNYEDNCSDFWIYTLANAEKLAVTFDDQTNTEDGFDYIQILDGSEQIVGKYTGKELAGKCIEVLGDTIRIQILSDESGNEWGFKVASVTAANTKPSGKSVKGQVKGYASNQMPEINLTDGTNTYSATVNTKSDSESGLHVWEFDVSGVPNGEYSLIINKESHLATTIKGVKVEDADLDLTDSENTDLSMIQLVAGDVNGDGAVNSSDLNTVWSSDNYFKSVGEDGVDSAADVNGDGTINSDDLNIIWKTENYLKVEADSEINY